MTSRDLMLECKERSEQTLEKITEENTQNKVENLKSILKGFGINTSEELDIALAEALDAMTLGIMTERLTTPVKSA